MDTLDWTPETEESGDDLFAGESYEFDDGEAAEFIGPAVGLAARQRLMRSRARRRPLPRPAGKNYLPRPQAPRAMPVSHAAIDKLQEGVQRDMAKISTALKTLETRLDSFGVQLAANTQFKAGEQSAELFRYALTSAAANVGPAIARKDWGQALSQALPLVQQPFSQSGRVGATTSVQTNPLSTFAFPAVTLASAVLFRKPDPPVLIQEAGGPVQITTNALFAKIRFTRDGTNPTESSTEYTAPIPVFPGQIIKAKVFGLFSIESDAASIVTSKWLVQAAAGNGQQPGVQAPIDQAAAQQIIAAALNAAAQQAAALQAGAQQAAGQQAGGQQAVGQQQAPPGFYPAQQGGQTQSQVKSGS